MNKQEMVVHWVTDIEFGEKTACDIWLDTLEDEQMTDELKVVTCVNCLLLSLN